MADQKFVDEINRPKNIVNEQQQPIVVIVPADHQRVEAKNAIENARTPVVHVG